MIAVWFSGLPNSAAKLPIRRGSISAVSAGVTLGEDHAPLSAGVGDIA